MPGAGDAEQSKCEVPTSGSVQMMALSAEIVSISSIYVTHKKMILRGQ